MEKIKKTISTFPSTPGVYKMIDKEGRVIYVGKAKNLTKRVKQYFQKNYNHSTRTRKMVEQINNIQVIETDTELEATILESTLIKQLMPKYNVIMKDDKNFVYIRITEEDFPRIQIVRKIEKDGSKYIGPKTAAHKVKDTLKLLKKLFPYRHCGLGIEFVKEGREKHDVKVTNKVIKYPCLDYHIKRCQGPCIGKCTQKEYKQNIESISKFLEGKGSESIKILKNQMQTMAQNREFEKAARLRDKIAKVESILEKQKVSSVDQKNIDIINYCTAQGAAYINLFQIRDGKLIGQENFTLRSEDLEEKDPEILKAFVKQYFEIAADKTKEILLPHEISDQKEIEEEYSIKITVPQIGAKIRLLEMSLKNAVIYAEKAKPTWKVESEDTKKAAEELKQVLGLEEFPKRIECYDISHLSGTDTVGSMIVFKNGAPDKKMYRKFKIKTVDNKPDDYKSMEEVLTRRLSKIGDMLNQKDLKIKKTIDKEEYILSENKKKIASISYSEKDEKTYYILPPKIEKTTQGEVIENIVIKKTLEKLKPKRIYVVCKKSDTEKYLKLGFDEIKKTPEKIKLKIGECVLVYDKQKHKEDESFTQIPDLIIIDGGKGQLGAATKIMKKFNIQVPYISLAKRLEEIFTPNSRTPIILGSNNEALKLLQRARDEAHRFAITYNKNLRSKRIKGPSR